MLRQLFLVRQSRSLTLGPPVWPQSHIGRPMPLPRCAAFCYTPIRGMSTSAMARWLAGVIRNWFYRGLKSFSFFTLTLVVGSLLFALLLCFLAVACHCSALLSSLDAILWSGVPLTSARLLLPPGCPWMRSRLWPWTAASFLNFSASLVSCPHDLAWSSLALAGITMTTLSSPAAPHLCLHAIFCFCLLDTGPQSGPLLGR